MTEAAALTNVALFTITKAVVTAAVLVIVVAVLVVVISSSSSGSISCNFF